MLGAAASAGVRRWLRRRRNDRTRDELQGNRVSTVAQVLHFAIQSSPAAVVVVDKREEVVLSNPRAHELGLVHERSLNPAAWGVVGRSSPTTSRAW